MSKKLIISFCLLLGTFTPLWAPSPEEEQKELSRIFGLIRDYLKKEDLRPTISADLAKTSLFPPYKTLSSWIKSSISYQMPKRRQTRKIKVEEVEYCYELSLPANYSLSKENPLVIALHGAGGDGNGALWIWRIPKEDEAKAKEKLLKHLKDTGQKIPEGARLIPVSVIGTRDYIIAAPTLPHQPHVGVAGNILDELIPVLLDDLISFCNIDTNRIFISGVSMGGHITWREIMLQPDWFAGAIQMLSGLIDMERLSNLANLPVYILQGEKDPSVEATRQAHKILTELKYDVTYREMKGLGHQLPLPKEGENTKILTWMKTKTRNPFPKRIVYKPLNNETKRIYWVELTPTQAGGATFEATIADNKITISSEWIKNITILLNSELVDFTKEVVVVANEKEIFRGKITPSYQFLLDDFLEHRDPHRLFTTKIDLELK